MTEPNPPRPVPGPPRPGPGGGPVPGPAATGTRTADVGSEPAASFAGLDQRPVAEHVAVFEAEHARLQRELGTIDQL
ncbi:hypothetical protein [Geodermatophilus sp. DSM 45219]|uniref:hypothetical protein n=1 Tax=Geodermatophilus sp. DSM 45219 TaxID=1881103 RepID=UPI000891C4B8|nr:hypothetical protein [Geodermatophilus sp. DSM 45219]SDN68305.1 hypothetical protein SAMN05428965_1130 [Geodermatophilus sp. DSM 45219]